MKKTFLLPLALCLLLCGCRTVTLTSFDTGEQVRVRAHSIGHKIWAHMPDGEVLEGHFASVTSGSVGFSFGSATAYGGGQTATAFGNGTSYNIGGSGEVYALLKSTKPGSQLMLEMIATFSPLNGTGFGQARTNDGRTYKLVF
jgi:hypothetical protein